ncbi:MAG: RNA polymerase sigma factor [Anaerolineae bacterium]
MTGVELKVRLETHHQAAFGWALGCCAQDPVEAEDVLQTVYLKILQGRARYEGESEFKTWLFAVIRKTAADARRRRGRHLFRLSQYHDHIATRQVTENPGVEREQPDIQTVFRRILAALPRRQREVLHLVFYHELTLQQTAKVLGISIGSVRTHYDRGKKRVRQLVEKCEACPEPSRRGFDESR